MKRRSAAVSNDPVAAEAASEVLVAGGSAVTAALAGFFAASGAYAGVLLGPLSVLTAGTGVGARAFDGRLRQPGLGAKRPRGFLPEESIPEAARVAVPQSVVAAAVALAYDGSSTLASTVKAGIARAERSGAASRVGVLKLVRSSGAGLLSDQTFVRALLRVAGPSQGGLLSPADFSNVGDVDREAVTRVGASPKLLEVPWASELEHFEPEGFGVGFALCAVDLHGVFCAVAYRRVVDGFVLDELELEAPLAAVPVLRGVTRVPPGERIPVPAPIAVHYDANGLPFAVSAAPNALRLEDPEAATLVIRRSPSTQEVEFVKG
jgi:hypothetical protein